jgi:hypothetical protein
LPLRFDRLRYEGDFADTVAESWFLAFNANIPIRPVMTVQGLAAAGPAIGKAFQDYGK